jgi:fatty acid desaturase
MMHSYSVVVSPILSLTSSPSGDSLASLPPAAEPTSVPGFARELRQLLPAEAFEPDRTLLPLSAINGAILLLGWLMADRLDQWPPLWLPLWLPFALIMGNSVFVLGLSMHDLLHGSAVRGPERRRLVALLGFSMSWMTPTLWQAVHNREHHQHTNGLTDPDRAYLEAQPRNWGKRLFQLIAPSLEVSPLGLALGMSSAWALHHFRTTCSVLLFNTGDTRFGPAPLRVSGRERRRIALELLAVIGLHAAVVIWLDAQPLKLLLGYFLPLWCAYAMAMAYIYTNHMLSPLREDNDPLLTSVSLKLPAFLDCLHGNFSHHSEHHVFPGLNGRFLPLVRQLLLQHHLDRYRLLSGTQAWRLLLSTPRLYRDAGTLTDWNGTRSMAVPMLEA